MSSLMVFLFSSGLVPEDGNQSRFFHFIVILCTQAKQMRRMITYCLFTISIFFPYMTLRLHYEIFFLKVVIINNLGQRQKSA